ncbi:hypothetical protein LguiB_017405 [Lonicera macranthoides]
MTRTVYFEDVDVGIPTKSCGGSLSNEGLPLLPQVKTGRGYKVGNHLEPFNSIQNNLDDCDRQSSDDTIIALPLDSHYNGDDNPDRGECNPHSGEQHLVASNPTPNSIKNNVNGYDCQSSKDMIIEVPLDSYYDGDDNPDGGECNPHSGEQHFLVSNPNSMDNNDNEFKVDVTPIFVIDEGKGKQTKRNSLSKAHGLPLLLCHMEGVVFHLQELSNRQVKGFNLKMQFQKPIEETSTEKEATVIATEKGERGDDNREGERGDGDEGSLPFN